MIFLFDNIKPFRANTLKIIYINRLCKPHIRFFRFRTIPRGRRCKEQFIGRIFFCIFIEPFLIVFGKRILIHIFSFKYLSRLRRFVCIQIFFHNPVFIGRKAILILLPLIDKNEIKPSWLRMHFFIKQKRDNIRQSIIDSPQIRVADELDCHSHRNQYIAFPCCIRSIYCSNGYQALCANAAQPFCMFIIIFVRQHAQYNFIFDGSKIRYTEL